MIGPFKGWCANAFPSFPSVYDDSMSYYELLCKLMYKLNESISQININEKNINLLDSKLNELKEYVDNYFKSVDFQSYVNNKLDEMASDGTLTKLFGTEIMLYNSPNIGGVANSNQLFIRSYIDPADDGTFPQSTVTTQSGCVTPAGYMVANIASDDTENKFACLVELDKNGNWIRTFHQNIGGHCNGMTYCPLTNTLWVAGDEGETYKVYIFNYETLELINSIEPTYVAYNIGYDKDTERIYSIYSNSDGTLKKCIEINPYTLEIKYYDIDHIPAGSKQDCCCHNGVIYLVKFNTVDCFRISDKKYIGSITLPKQSTTPIILQEFESVDYDESLNNFVCFVTLHQNVGTRDINGNNKRVITNHTYYGTLSLTSGEGDSLLAKGGMPVASQTRVVYINNTSQTLQKMKNGIFQTGSEDFPFLTFNINNFNAFMPYEIQVNFNFILPSGDFGYRQNCTLALKELNVDNNLFFKDCEFRGIQYSVNVSKTGVIVFRNCDFKNLQLNLTNSPSSKFDVYGISDNILNVNGNGNLLGGEGLCSYRVNNCKVKGNCKILKGSRWDTEFGLTFTANTELPFKNLYYPTYGYIPILAFINAVSGENQVFCCFPTSTKTLREIRGNNDPVQCTFSQENNYATLAENFPGSYNVLEVL